MKSALILLPSLAFAQESVSGWSNFWDYALDVEGPAGHSHAHNASLDGHCIACVGARRIFCMDGDENNQNLEVQEYGSCQPSWAYCTWGGRDLYYTRSNFKQCEYKGVSSPNTGETYTE